jgi:hypothetical protein
MASSSVYLTAAQKNPVDYKLVAVALMIQNLLTMKPTLPALIGAVVYAIVSNVSLYLSKL